jgi:hypothetical protein
MYVDLLSIKVEVEVELVKLEIQMEQVLEEMD